VRNNLGIALATLGRIEEADVQFQKAVDLDPGYAEARKNLSLVRRQATPPQGGR
jgi:Flp pilus assembly protein TadD